MTRVVAFLVGCLASAVAGLLMPGVGVGAEGGREDIPVELTADELSYDRELGIVTARGNVEITHRDRTLKADTISYNQNTNVITATGNIVLLEPTGDVLFGEHMELSGDLKDGIIETFGVVLADGSRIAAAGARRSNYDMEMSKGVYSPCNLCPEEPTKAPLWQIKAVKVFHDKDQRRIEYRDAWLEVAGMPVAYTPYLSHPDPTVKRKSGLLAPSFGNSSDLGVVIQVPYYWVISPQRDATITPIITTDEGPVLAAEYRQKVVNGEFDLEISITEDSKDDVRGHVRSSARFDVDDTWRWGFDANRTTDDTYLRRYGFRSEDSLTSRLFAEGFKKRNYLTFNAYAFQGLAEGDDPGTTPLVLPMLDYIHLGEVDRFGGRSRLDVNLLALTRNEGTDSRRLSVRPGWDLPLLGPFGDAYEISATLIADLYHVNSLVRADADETFSGFSGRLVPELSLDWRLPLVRSKGAFQQVLEPIGTLILSPYGGNPTKIPNEDSQEFEFDDTNLFGSNRFSGLDRIEGGPRIHYGLKWGLFGDEGGTTTVLIGQSYRPREDDTFPERSGLEDNFSDFVGRVRVSPAAPLSFFYRTRIDKDNLEIRRNELTFSAGLPALNVNANYVFFEGQDESKFPGREEISMGVSSRLSRYWRGSLSGVRDVANDEMRSFNLNLTYEDECLVFVTSASRTFFQDRDLRPTDAITFRVIFKTLGEVGTGAQKLN